MSGEVERLVRALGMQSHPEGGHFVETFRSPERLSGDALPARFGGGSRAMSTAILYLLAGGESSRWHRLRADEVWHHHVGGPLTLHLLVPGEGHRELVLGRDAAAGERLQAVVPHGTWFGAEVAPGIPFALVGCTVSPGFEFEDFELGTREALAAEFPSERAWVERLTAAKES